MASFVAPEILQSEELRLLLRPNQFGSDPRYLTCPSFPAENVVGEASPLCFFNSGQTGDCPLNSRPWARYSLKSGFLSGRNL